MATTASYDPNDPTDPNNPNYRKPVVPSSQYDAAQNPPAPAPSTLPPGVVTTAGGTSGAGSPSSWWKTFDPSYTAPVVNPGDTSPQNPVYVPPTTPAPSGPTVSNPTAPAAPSSGPTSPAPPGLPGVYTWTWDPTSASWKQTPVQGGNGSAPPATSTPSTPTDPTIGTGAIPGTPDTGTGDANGAFMQTLLALLHPGAVNQNDPRISGAIAANNLALQRGAEAQRAQQAEVNAQTGIDASGGANTMNQGILEDMASKQGQFAGQEVQHLGDQENQDMLASLGALGAFLPQQEQIANQWAEHEATLTEQAREADVDAALKKLGIETQGNLGQADIALRDKLGASQEGLALLSTLLQMQEFGANLDSQTILGLLGSVG